MTTGGAFEKKIAGSIKNRRKKKDWNGEACPVSNPALKQENA